MKFAAFVLLIIKLIQYALLELACIIKVFFNFSSTKSNYNNVN